MTYRRDDRYLHPNRDDRDRRAYLDALAAQGERIEALRARTIENMRVGETGWTVPWAFNSTSFTLDGYHGVNPARQGAARLKITRLAHGFRTEHTDGRVRTRVQLHGNNGCPCVSCDRTAAEAEAEATLARAEAVAKAKPTAEDVAKSEADQRAEEILAAGQRKPPAWDPLGAAPFAWNLPEPKPITPKKSRRQRVKDWPSNGGLSLTYYACALIWYALLVFQLVTGGHAWIMGLDLIAGSLYLGAAVMTRKTERLQRERKARTDRNRDTI